MPVNATAVFNKSMPIYRISRMNMENKLKTAHVEQ
jgi:hypothetical protein